ncbi:GDSL esterase/lipase At5g45910 [Setaria italica]|uniref:GDSL esterase/lipase At5g45910 n=1 Tax=Setaria italica TaxID=4555 RepID=UPI0003513015|nr:GDSL esterase/lipase At5g45910 [Setaria italica]
MYFDYHVAARQLARTVSSDPWRLLRGASPSPPPPPSPRVPVRRRSISRWRRLLRLHHLLPRRPRHRALPYGETFFRRPTGRFCDGRLIVDFIAEAPGLPFSPLFLRGGGGRTAEEFRHGANFAVGTATALGKDFFREMGLSPALVRFIPPCSLDVQMEWFKQVLRLLGPTEQERKGIMPSSLFVVGEIGENDYSYLILQNRSLDAVIKPLVIPKVVAKIENAIKVLIDLGARTIVVPGHFPMGCLPRYLTMLQSTDPGDYDASGCIRRLNDLIQQHNRAIRTLLARIPRDPAVAGFYAAVVYADYYEAGLEIIRTLSSTAAAEPPSPPACRHRRPSRRRRHRLAMRRRDQLLALLLWLRVVGASRRYRHCCHGWTSTPLLPLPIVALRPTARRSQSYCLYLVGGAGDRSLGKEWRWQLAGATRPQGG